VIVYFVVDWSSARLHISSRSDVAYPARLLPLHLGLVRAARIHGCGFCASAGFRGRQSVRRIVEVDDPDSVRREVKCPTVTVSPSAFISLASCSSASSAGVGIRGLPMSCHAANARAELSSMHQRKAAVGIVAPAVALIVGDMIVLRRRVLGGCGCPLCWLKFGHKYLQPFDTNNAAASVSRRYSEIRTSKTNFRWRVHKLSSQMFYTAKLGENLFSIDSNIILFTQRRHIQLGGIRVNSIWLYF
jgi:hypothetical protein